MKKLIGVFLTILISVSLIPLFISMSDSYNEANTEETFTAIVVEATLEVFTVEETPVEVTKVTVEGVELTLTTEYTVSGKAITVLANNSDVDEIVVIYYTYELATTNSQDVLVDLIPTIIIISIVAGVALSIYKNKNS